MLSCNTSLFALQLARKALPQGFKFFLRHGPVAGLSQHIAQKPGKAFAYAVGRGLCQMRLRG